MPMIVRRKRRGVIPVSIVAALALLAGGALAGVRGSASAKADCSEATALRLVNEHKLNGFLGPNPVAQYLCGPFTGPGSEALAVTIRAETCWPIQAWAVFELKGGSWQLVLDRHDFVAPPLVAVRADIRETTPVFRPGDPRCIPSGGTHARTWHWDGTRFTAGPWKQVTPGTAVAPSGSFKSGFFKTPSGNILCVHANGTGAASVGCVVKSGLEPPPPRRGPGCSPALVVGLSATGRVHTEGSECPGEDAPETPYVGADVARVLGYGKTWSGGGINCASAISGLTCRNKSGHGFFLSREHWRAF